MNKINRFIRNGFAWLIAAAMVVGTIAGTGAAVMAEGETESHTITIDATRKKNVSLVGRTFTAYKLFDLTYAKSAESGESSSESGSGTETASSGTSSTNAVPHAYTLSKDSPFYNEKLTSTTNEQTKPGANSSISDILRYYFTFTSVSGGSELNVTPKDTFTGDDGNREFADAIAPKLAEMTKEKYPAQYDKYVFSVTGTATAPKQAVINLPEGTEGQGYYIVTTKVSPENTKSDEKVIAAVSLTNADPAATVDPKVEIPSIDKKITGVTESADGETPAEEPSSVAGIVDKDSSGKGTVASAQVGDTVSFELTSTVPDLTGYSDYLFEFHDTLSEGLTPPKAEDVAVKIGEGDKAKTLTHYTEESKDTTAEAGTCRVTVSGQDMTIRIPFASLQETAKDGEEPQAIAPGTPITVTYSAAVNEKALEHSTEDNTAYVTYSNSPYLTRDGKRKTADTPDKKTYVINVNLDVKKVSRNSAKTPLAGAKFRLYRKAGSGASASGSSSEEKKEYYHWDDTKKAVSWIAESTASDSAGSRVPADVDTFTTEADGHLMQTVRGLGAGTYYLEETKAPEGYHRRLNPVEINIAISVPDGENAQNAVITASNTDAAEGKTISLTNDAENTAHTTLTAEVANTRGWLPVTGGSGTAAFYLIGGIIAAGAAALLIARKKTKRPGRKERVSGPDERA